MDPDQIFPTDIGPRKIISSWRHSSLLWHHNQSQPTWAPTKYLQQTSGLPQSLSGINHLCCQTPRLLPKILNIRHNPTNYSQLPPWLPEILSTDDRYSEPSVLNPLEQSKILSPGGPLTLSSKSLLGCIPKVLFAFICIFVCLAHPFIIKITIVGCSYPFHTCTLIKLRINPGEDYLNRTAFLQNTIHLLFTFLLPTLVWITQGNGRMK